MFFPLNKIFFFCLYFLINILNFYNSANIDNSVLSNTLATTLIEGLDGNGANMHTCEAAGCSSYKNIIKNNSDECLYGFICKKCKKTHAKSPNICFYSSLEGYENLYEGLLEDFSNTKYDTFNVPLNKKDESVENKNVSTTNENKKTGDDNEKEEDESDEKEDNTKQKNKKEKSNSTKKEEDEDKEEDEEEEDDEEESKKELKETNKKKNKSNVDNDEESFLEQYAGNIYYNSMIYGKKNKRKNRMYNQRQFKKKFTSYSTLLEPDIEYKVREEKHYSLLEKSTEEKKMIHRRLKININKYEDYLKSKLNKCDVSDDGTLTIYIKLIFQIVKDKDEIYTDVSKKSIIHNEGANDHSKSEDDIDDKKKENDEDLEENEDDEEKESDYKNEKNDYGYERNDEEYENSSFNKIEHSFNPSHNNETEEPDYTKHHYSQKNQYDDANDYGSMHNRSYSNPNLSGYSYIDLHNSKIKNNFFINENSLNDIKHYKIEKNGTYKESANKSNRLDGNIKKEQMVNILKNYFPPKKGYSFYQYKFGDDLGGEAMENYYKSNNGFFKSIFKKIFKKKREDDDTDSDDKKPKKKGGLFSRKKRKNKEDDNDNDDEDERNDKDEDHNDNNEDEDEDEEEDKSLHSNKGKSKEKSKDKKKKKKKKSLFSKFKSKYFPKKQKLHIEAYFNSIIVKTCKNSLKWKGKMFRKHSLIEMTLKVPVKLKYIKNEPLNFFRSGYEVIMTCKNCDEVLFNSCVQVYCTKKSSKLPDNISNTISNSSNLNTTNTMAFAPIPYYNYGYQDNLSLNYFPYDYYSSCKSIYIKYSIVILIFITLLI
ncbi:conserved Plasmodium protein, unknown function [Plasmodium relictum]|uniref:Surface-related antigen SRA n=1 Tax=Plasmodium relictum TaxID=85471 RepID=A0A1J1HDI3_PLARL|nr:conserved Plasmodium protein, unknown function [Plasmodium relictum]CRH03838.1 conserved Plasmodium protein, unknown function [Plasmodium relictum]